jgi:hypothetical protein
VAANRTDTLTAASLGTARVMASYLQEDMMQPSVGTLGEVWCRGGIRFRQQKEQEEAGASLQAVGIQGRLRDNHQPKLQSVSLPQQQRKVEGVANMLKACRPANGEADTLSTHAVAEKEVDTLDVYGPATYALRRVLSVRV